MMDEPVGQEITDVGCRVAIAVRQAFEDLTIGGVAHLVLLERPAAGEFGFSFLAIEDVLLRLQCDVADLRSAILIDEDHRQALLEAVAETLARHPGPSAQSLLEGGCSKRHHALSLQLLWIMLLLLLLLVGAGLSSLRCG